MLQPPLYLRLREAGSGRLVNVLLANVHIFQPHNKAECDEPGCKAESEIITILPYADENGVAAYPMLVLETEAQIEAKMRRCLGNFVKLSIQFSKSAKAEGDEWKDGNDDGDGDGDDQGVFLWA